MLRKRILSVLAALAVALGVGGFALAHAGAATRPSASTASAPRGWYIDANGLPHLLPKRANAVPGAAGDYASMWYRGDTLDPVAAPVVGDSGTKIVHKAVTVNADYQAGTEADRTVTFTGLPAYTSSGTAEVWGSNAEGVPDAFGTAATDARIAVTKTTPANGQTVRKFLVTPTGFNGSESFTLDIWVLVTT